MLAPDVSSVLTALARYKNVLLEGPPGTGKTRLVTDVISAISNISPSTGGGRPQIRPGAGFGSDSGQSFESPLPESMTVEWVTFHQSFAYEEFILGRRPIPNAAGGIRLEPYFGVLTSLAVGLGDYNGSRGVLLVIDEINRANASQVFGEFITMLDPEYRSTVDGGSPNPRKVSPRFPGIAYAGDLSEEITLLRGGGSVALPSDWAFPENFYVLATMNSVDKAALPLDSALTRRFHRIFFPPNMEQLAIDLNLSMIELALVAKLVRNGGDRSDLSVEATAYLLLERLNLEIAKDLSSDFELGQGLLWPVVSANESSRWDALIHCWDHAILPQLVERFAGRGETLREVLKIDGGTSSGSVFKARTLLGVTPSSESEIELPSLSEVPESQAKATLRWLAV